MLVLLILAVLMAAAGWWPTRSGVEWLCQKPRSSRTDIAQRLATRISLQLATACGGDWRFRRAGAF